MFSSVKKHSSYASKLELSDESLDTAARRLSGFLNSVMKKNNQFYITKKNIKDSLFILVEEMRISKEQQVKGNVMIFGKSKVIKRYSKEIIGMYQKNYGYQRISNELRRLHKAKVSVSTVRNFLKNNNIQKGKSDG